MLINVKEYLLERIQEEFEKELKFPLLDVFHVEESSCKGSLLFVPYKDERPLITMTYDLSLTYLTIKLNQLGSNEIQVIMIEYHQLEKLLDFLVLIRKYCFEGEYSCSS